MTWEGDSSRKRVGNDFSALFVFPDAYRGDLANRAAMLAPQTDASSALREAIAYASDRGLVWETVIDQAAVERLCAFAEKHPHPDRGDDPNALPGPDYFLPRIYFWYRLADVMARQAQAIIAEDGIFPSEEMNELHRANFQLGALCREYQLSRDNARDALHHKRTSAKLQEGRETANAGQKAKADQWRRPIMEEAERRWAIDPRPSPSELAPRLRRWLLEQDLGFTDANTVNKDTIRKAIGKISPRRKKVGRAL